MTNFSRTYPVPGLRTIAAAIVLGVLGLFVAPAISSAEQANLTRFGPEDYERTRGKPTTSSSSFTASEGPGKLLVRNRGVRSARITVNGRTVVRSRDLRGTMIERPVKLSEQNQIKVSLRGKPGGVLRVRVTQRVDVDFNIVGQTHFGLNTSDFERQLAFYHDTLGFEGLINPAGPETNTLEVAQTLGLDEPYRLKVALSSVDAPAAPPFIDTVEFIDPYRGDPPYANLNHLGMAYATYGTTDLDGDVAYLKSEGVELVSAPATAPGGERFVFLKGPDGTFFKLVQDDDGEAPTDTADLTRLLNTNMNVSDMRTSRGFYRMLGFTESENSSQRGSARLGRAYGLRRAIKFKGKDVSLGAGTDGATLQLRRWKRPYDDAPPYPLPVNHLGINRIALSTTDLTADVATMRELKIPQVGPIAPCCSGPDSTFGIAMFQDPDGINVELAGPITGSG